MTLYGKVYLQAHAAPFFYKSHLFEILSYLNVETLCQLVAKLKAELIYCNYLLVQIHTCV